MLCHSEDVAVRWNRLDYVGIVVLISGTFVPAVHYGFFCDAHLRNRYIALIYTFAAATTATVVSPHARTPEYRRFRTWIFIAMGCSAVLPVGHAILRYGVRQTTTSLRFASGAAKEADFLSSTTGRGRVDGDLALLAGTRRGPLHHRCCAVSPFALYAIVRTAKRMAGTLDRSHCAALASGWRPSQALGARATLPDTPCVYRSNANPALKERSHCLRSIDQTDAPLLSLSARSYTERCPERFSPGSFDFVLSSHQIFHILILLAAWSHWTAIAEAHRFWHGTLGGQCPAWALAQD